MTLTLIIFSQLCLIMAIWGVWRRQEVDDNWTTRLRVQDSLRISALENRPIAKVNYSQIEGKMNQLMIQSKLAEKMADRAFNMASSANVGIVVLQRALAVPRLMTKAQGVRNEVAKNGVEAVFTKEGNMDWLRPILSDEENDLLDKAEELHNKEIMNGSKG